MRTALGRRLQQAGIIAILRADSAENIRPAIDALVAGGITALEVTLTTPTALAIIGEVAAAYGERILIGAGTVLDPENCRTAILAGAEFIVTPVTKPEVIRMAKRYAKPIFNGAFTPTEALLGYEAGADFIKLFPADQLGPAYVKNLLAPLPMLPLVPTGGVTPENLGDYLRAGSVAVGVGSTLVHREALRNGDFAAITARAREFLQALQAARGGSSPLAV